MQKALFPGYTVGPDAYEDIVNICSAYGKKAAIIGGRKALAAAEPQIRKAVEGSGIEITGTFWYGGEASRENMDMLRPQVADADMIFAVGGGKAIDTCKVLAHETNRPFFTFPTIVYALRKPDPWPRVFGFHEIFHCGTVAGYACHMVAIYMVIVSLWQ